MLYINVNNSEEKTKTTNLKLIQLIGITFISKI